MMQAYVFDRSRFAYETFAEEIVVLDLADGTYFAFGGSAVEIWPALTHATPINRIAEAFPGDPSSDAIEREIQEFASKLVEEGILIATEAATNGAAVTMPSVEFRVSFNLIREAHRHAGFADPRSHPRCRSAEGLAELLGRPP